MSERWQLARRFRIPAVMCALAVLVCELVSRPYTTMGVCDDMSYILIARKVAETGHIFYNGPTTPMLGWQLYLGAAVYQVVWVLADDGADEYAAGVDGAWRLCCSGCWCGQISANGMQRMGTLALVFRRCTWCCRLRS